MAMESRLSVPDAHSKTITSIQYNSFRREIYTAGEDSLIRVWEAETGKPVGTWAGHSGWVTSLLYCKEIKILFSSSIDGTLVAWGPSGKPIQKVQTNNPIYCLTYNPRHHQILAGHNKKVRLFQLINPEESHSATEVLEKKSVTCGEHTDVVSCLVSCEGRFYSAGFDKKILIYDVPHHSDLKIKVATTISNAHDAAISCMIFAKDADNSWIVTGSFDRVVKLWSLDGNLLQRFDGFMDTITALSYVSPTQTLWITANSPAPIVFDPRSGVNVSDFIYTHDNQSGMDRRTYFFKSLIYIPEVNEIIGTTSRRSLTVWRYNPYAPLTILPGHADIVECLTFTQKEPILLYSGGDDGLIRKWERMQLNTFMYSQETLALPKEEKIERPIKDYLQTHTPRSGLSRVQKHKKPSTTSHTSRPGVSILYYFEEMDVLIAGYEDSRICVWGYNEESDGSLIPDELKGPESMHDAASNRVSGMSLKLTFSEHKDVVTGVTCISQNGHYWMVSTGWDRRICIFDLKNQKIHSTFHNRENGYGREELAADGLILDLDYCPERNEFAYCSADKQGYIRRFSPQGESMTLVAVLQGHEAEVTKIRWHRKGAIWITASEDRTIRLWPAEGIPCIRVINNDGPVTALAIDASNGCVITGSQDKTIRVFDLDRKDEVVQKNQGHQDEIKAIVHIPARNQYVSASWDNTVRIWNSYLKKGQRRIAVKEGANTNTNHTYYDIDETAPTYADLNPLIVPKMLTKGIYVKDTIQERVINEDEVTHVEQSRLEEDLRATLNDLEVALNTPDKMTPRKAKEHRVRLSPDKEGRRTARAPPMGPPKPA